MQSASGTGAWTLKSALAMSDKSHGKCAVKKRSPLPQKLRPRNRHSKKRAAIAGPTLQSVVNVEIANKARASESPLVSTLATQQSIKNLASMFNAR